MPVTAIRPFFQAVPQWLSGERTPNQFVTTQAMLHFGFYAPKGQNVIAQGVTLGKYDNTNAP